MKTRVLNGYIVVYDPEHPKAMTSNNWKGFVYEHVKVAEASIGRELRPTEVVHHLDMNRANNRPENLLVLEDGQHTKLHNWLRSCAPESKDSGVNRVNSGKPKELYCKTCEKLLSVHQAEFCSKRCVGLHPSRRIVERPTKEQLELDLQSSSWVAVGTKYGVSDNSVRKWAKQYGLR